MKIEWLGHSAFRLEESTGTVVVTDPFSADIVGYDMPMTEADIVTVSHDHADHNALDRVTGNYTLLNKIGAYEL